MNMIRQSRLTRMKDLQLKAAISRLPKQHPIPALFLGQITPDSILHPQKRQTGTLWAEHWTNWRTNSTTPPIKTEKRTWQGKWKSPKASLLPRPAWELKTLPTKRRMDRDSMPIHRHRIHWRNSEERLPAGLTSSMWMPVSNRLTEPINLLKTARSPLKIQYWEKPILSIQMVEIRSLSMWKGKNWPLYQKEQGFEQVSKPYWKIIKRLILQRIN